MTVIDIVRPPILRPPQPPRCPVVFCAPPRLLSGSSIGSTKFPVECPTVRCNSAPTPIGCPRIYFPVCGSDGRTYGNECEATRAGVSVVSYSPCEQPNDPSDCICTLEYIPVCGTDNKTYGNRCKAKCDGVTVAYEGACKPVDRPPTLPPKPLPDPPKPGIPPKPGSEVLTCLGVHQPVCDEKTGTTYWNSCYARNAGVFEFVENACIPVDTTKPGGKPGPVKPGGPFKPADPTKPGIPGKPNGPILPKPGDPNPKPPVPGGPVIGGNNPNPNVAVCDLF